MLLNTIALQYELMNTLMLNCQKEMVEVAFPAVTKHIKLHRDRGTGKMHMETYVSKMRNGNGDGAIKEYNC